MFSPLDSCTLSGIDEGAEALNMNLFRDYLYALDGNRNIILTEEEYYSLPIQNLEYK